MNHFIKYGLTVIKFAILLTIGGLAIMFILQQLFSFFLDTQGATSKMKQDIEELNDELDSIMHKLSPWEDNDFELLSFNRVEETKSKSVNPVIKGILTNIYQENLVAFAYKEYYQKKKKAILIARTSAHEFYYKITKKAVEAYRDNIHLGTLSADGSFYQSNALVAHIDKSKSMSLLPIKLNGKKVASLVNPIDHTYPNTRAVQIFEDVTEDEKELILSISLFELIHRTNKI